MLIAVLLLSVFSCFVNTEARVPALDCHVRDRKPKLSKSPGNYVATVARTIRLECHVLNWKPGWRMDWYMNGKLIQTNETKRFKPRNGKRSKLSIQRVQSTDAGPYKCAASNKYGRVEKELDLTVVDERNRTLEHGKGQPWFTKPWSNFRSLFWPTSRDVVLRCPADGEPPLKFQWLKDGKVLKYRGLDPKINTARSILKIKTAAITDNGLYTCVVSNRLGSISQTLTFKAVEKTPNVKPILAAYFPINKTVRVGENVSFHCLELFSTTLTDYRWIYWNKVPPSYLDLNSFNSSASSSKYSVINPKQYVPLPSNRPWGAGRYGGKVLLNNVRKDDEGMYTCLVRNIFGASWRSAFLKILPAESTPSLEKSSKKEKLPFDKSFNDSGKMACSVNVELKKPVKWRRYRWLNHKVRPKDTRQFTITLKSVKPEKSEMYSCNVSNQYESINMTYESRGPDMCGPMLEAFQDVEAKEGENVTLTCKAYNPDNKPKLIWFAFDNDKKQYRMIQPGKLTELTAIQNKEQGWRGERLRLLEVTPGDTKKYLCFGINAVVTRQHSVFVRVLPNNQQAKVNPGYKQDF